MSKNSPAEMPSLMRSSRIRAMSRPMRKSSLPTAAAAGGTPWSIAARVNRRRLALVDPLESSPRIRAARRTDGGASRSQTPTTAPCNCWYMPDRQVFGEFVSAGEDVDHQSGRIAGLGRISSIAISVVPRSPKSRRRRRRSGRAGSPMTFSSAWRAGHLSCKLRRG